MIPVPLTVGGVCVAGVRSHENRDRLDVDVDGLIVDGAIGQVHVEFLLAGGNRVVTR